jgi:hypothetical protein
MVGILSSVNNTKLASDLIFFYSIILNILAYQCQSTGNENDPPQWTPQHILHNPKKLGSQQTHQTPIQDPNPIHIIATPQPHPTPIPANN